MPLTPAHPAAVLPLVGTPLPAAALVAGAVAPDSPLWLGWPPYPLTHSLVGALLVAPLVGVAYYALWALLLRDALADLAPDAVRLRVPATARPSRRQWLLAIPAAVIGACTHVGWDAFTHEGRWGVDLVPALEASYAGARGYTWAQQLSTVLGVFVVAAFVTLRLRRVLPRPAQGRRGPWGPSALALLLGLALVAGVAVAVVAGGGGAGAFDGFVASLRVLLAGLVALVVTWRWRTARR